MQKVFIIEDDPKIAEHLQSHLVKYGYDAAAAEQFDDVMGNFISINRILCSWILIFRALMAITGAGKSGRSRFVQLYSFLRG